jgi:hypothetical protein
MPITSRRTLAFSALLSISCGQTSGQPPEPVSPELAVVESALTDTGSYDSREEFVFDTAPEVQVTVDDDLTPPEVSLTSPVEGAIVSGTVLLQASATDDKAVARVEFYTGTQLIGSDTTAPYEAAWKTWSGGNGPVVFSAKAFDTAGNMAESAPVHVTSATPGLASYDEALGAPACTMLETSCDSGGLLWGTGPGAGELHQPNTLASSCPDVFPGGTQAAPSLDRLSVSTIAGTFQAGKRVRVQATVWSALGGERLDLYYATEAASPSWVYLTTVSLASTGRYTFTASYVLPAGGPQALRGVLSHGGASAWCNTLAAYVDHDDLVFAVGSEPDTTPPTVRLSVPGGGTVLRNHQVITASAVDDYDVARVDLYAGSTLLGTMSPSGQFGWDTRTVANGVYTLTAVAHDTAGLSSTSTPLQVTVDNDYSPPTVSITSPTEGASFGGSISVLVSASDDRQVQSVSFFLNGNSLGTDTWAPFETVFSTRKYPNGSYLLTARASDGTHVTTSSPVQVWINNDLPPPSVSLSSPLNGDTVSGTVTLEAQATGSGGISEVVFYRGSMKLGFDTTAPYTFTWQTGLEPNGPASLTVRARDLSGNVATSATVNVTVSNDPGPKARIRLRTSASAQSAPNISRRTTGTGG